MIVYDLARLACGLCQVHHERIERVNHVQTTNHEFSPILLNFKLRVVVVCNAVQASHSYPNWSNIMSVLGEELARTRLTWPITKTVCGSRNESYNLFLALDTLSCRLGWWLSNVSKVLCQTNGQASHYIQAQTHNVLCQTNRQASHYTQAQTHNVLCQTNRQNSHFVQPQTHRVRLCVCISLTMHVCVLFWEGRHLLAV